MKIIKPYHIIESEIDYQKILAHLEKCGRVCYQSGDLANEKSAEKFIGGIIKSGHESVIEHISITVRFITNRGVTHEMVRHRLASYSQESTRYCSYNRDKFDNQLTYIQPPWFKTDIIGEHDIKWIGVYGADTKSTHRLDKAENRWFWNCAVGERDYLRLLDEGWIPQQARDVLNNSIKTEIVMTCNVREWREVFRQRCSKYAHPEIREIMIPTLIEFQEKMPILFNDIEYYKGE